MSKAAGGSAASAVAFSPAMIRSSSSSTRSVAAEIRTARRSYRQARPTAPLHRSDTQPLASLPVLATRFRALLRHPLRGRVTKFAISSALAATTSAIVFPVLYVLGASTTLCTVLAFFAGAIPNWTLNRRWTWKVEGRVAFGREIVAYLVLS